MSQPLCFFLITLFVVLMKSQGNDYLSPSSSTICPSAYDCGNVTISYPFWSINNTSDQSDQIYCGYPDFGVTCSNGEPILQLPGDTYYVRDINYTAHTIALVDIDVTVQNDCPRARHNLTIDSLPLGYSNSDLNISFYFNCSSNRYFGSAIGCLSSVGLQSYVSVLANGSEGPDWFGICQENVVVTVMKTHVTADNLINRFATAMNNGFELDWRVLQDCLECEASSGYCAHNITTGEFSCVCNDHIRAHHCRGNSWTPKRKIGMGVGVSVGAALILSAGFLIWYRRDKNQSAPSFVSNIIASDSSSQADIEKWGHFNGIYLFTYEELEAATNNFDSTRELGEGGFGTVYYGKLHDGRAVAVKRLFENHYRRVRQFMNEVDILTRLRHPHLVSLYGCTSRNSRELLLVYEYVPNGTVADHLHSERAKPGGLPWNIRMNIAVETACALAYLHKSDIIHRDVKTSNILLDNNFKVKVADFGLSRLFPTDVTHVSTAPRGTPGYVDPEYYECYQLTCKSDVFSFGVVLIELISSMRAVDITRHRQEINLSNLAINKIRSDALNELVDPSLGFESDYAVRKMVIAVAELAFQCLQCAKDMRPPMDEVLEILKEIQNMEYDMEKTEDSEDSVTLSDMGF